MKSILILENLKSIDFNFNKSKIIEDTYNKAYDSFNFEINNITYSHRTGKKTPTKKGYFTVLWTKDDFHKNRPLNYHEMRDKLIITIIDNHKVGIFVFPKDVLLLVGILSNGTKKGKMGFRVYPTWETNLNKTALATQSLQSNYFIDLSKHTNQDKLIALLT